MANTQKQSKAADKNKGLKTYYIETDDSTAIFGFFTEAENQKKALGQLITSSSDFKNLAKENRNLTITVKRVAPMSGRPVLHKKGKDYGKYEKKSQSSS